MKFDDKLKLLIKQMENELNQTPIKRSYKIIDDDLRDAYFREMIQRKFPKL